MRYSGILAIALVGTLANLSRAADEFELPPIEYSRSTPANRVSNLLSALERGELSLRHDPKFGYLPDLLEKLEIPASSQLLVFSKTSLQRDRIAPRTPRAIYFNDDAYVGYCHAGEMLEISACDPELGTVFYTLDQDRDAVPRMTRQTEKCLQCHGTAQADNVPGHTVRSVFVDGGGLPMLGEGSHRVNQTTPIEDRWGGWYVTGTHGTQTHLGNFIVRDRRLPRPWNNDAGQNVTDLSERLPTDRYLTPHSDLVALMVFEHQTYVQNLLTKANFAARQALHYEAGLNKSLGEPPTNRLESTTRRIESASEKLVQGLLFVDEAPLKGPFAGTSGFAEQFAKSAQRDPQGRSLRDLDLQTRLFKYPCSYLIYSREFDGLPAEIKASVASRITKVLKGEGGDKYAHLSEADRQAISEILTATKPELLLPGGTP